MYPRILIERKPSACPACLLQLLCQVSLVALLFGTNLGALAQLGQGASYAIARHWPSAPAWLYHEGIAPILLFTLGLVFPLTMLRSMRQVH